MKSIEIVLHFPDGHSTQSTSRVELFYAEKAHAAAVFAAMLEAELQYRERHGQDVILHPRVYSIVADPGKLLAEGKAL